jgi:deoxyribonuclease V
MKLPRPLHSWSLSPRQAVTLQQRMARLVSQTRTPREPSFIAGLDAAFSKDERRCFSAVVLWDICEQRVVEEHTASRKLTFPYVPGLLSFREVPVLLTALRNLKRQPDLLMCDGQGVAHPRRFGLACHLGVICGLPSLGCAKSRLIGTHAAPARRRGSRAALFDRGEVIGTVLRTQTGVKPVYVSIGHQIDLPTAEEIVLACATCYRLPEPTRLADKLVAAFKRQVMAQ